MLTYDIEWNDDNVTVLKAKPKGDVELGTPLKAHAGLIQAVREKVASRQGITLGCKVLNIKDPHWTWITLSNALVSVFGYQVSPVAIELLVTDKSGHVAELYKAQHGKAFS